MKGSRARRSILFQVASVEQCCDCLSQWLCAGIWRNKTKWKKGSIGVRDVRRFSDRMLDEYDSAEFFLGKDE
jgi:hypothetical protein